MPIQYQPAPEFQVPNLNLMGAYAQGQALQQQQLQEERLRQQMDLAERAAGYTANKDIREAAKLQSEQAAKDFELASKKYDYLVGQAPRLNAQNYGAWHKQVVENFPLAAATLPTEFTPDVPKMLSLQAADLKPQVLQQHFGDTSRFVRIGPTGGAEIVPGSEASAPTQWEPIKQGDFIIGYKSKYGPQQITPEEFQSLSQRQKRSEGPSTQEVAEYINQRAPQMGVDPRVANRVFTQGEYGGKYVGDQGSSFGPTQLHYGGMAPGGNRVAGLGDEFTKATGLDARDPSTWREQIDFSLGQAAKGGWGPWHAAKKVGVGEYEGINAMAPRQIASAGPLNGMLAPPMQLPSAAPQPQPAVPTPLKSYAPAPIGTKQAQEQNSALDLLNAFEYNPETGSSRPAELLQSAGGGRTQQVWEGLTNILGISTPAARAGGRLASSQKGAVLKMIQGKMGQGFTDQDRNFVMDSIGDLDNTGIAIGTRLEKFDEAMRMLARNAGVPYKPAPQLENLRSLGGRGKAGETPKAKPLTGRIKFMELGD